jgi:hypothetical protein
MCASIYAEVRTFLSHFQKRYANYFVFCSRLDGAKDIQISRTQMRHNTQKMHTLFYSKIFKGTPQFLVAYKRKSKIQIKCQNGQVQIITHHMDLCI